MISSTSMLAYLSRGGAAPDSLTLMEEGSLLIKVRPKQSVSSCCKEFTRHYFLDMPNLRISYHPSKDRFIATSNKPHEAFLLEDITEIRTGHATDTFHDLLKHESKGLRPSEETSNLCLDPERCFSLILIGKHKGTLDLVAETQEIRDTWVSGLSQLVEMVKESKHQSQYETFLRLQIKRADKTRRGYLNLKQSHSLIKKLCRDVEVEELEDALDRVHVEPQSSKTVMSQDDFIQMYYKFLHFDVIEALFKQYAICSPELGLTEAEWTRFWQVEQKQDGVTPEIFKEAVAQFQTGTSDTHLTHEGFVRFLLFSDHTELTDTSKTTTVYQDMTLPLSHYWIASSHNTYLTGQQITSRGSVDAYITVLKKGCRCIELDCWDGRQGEPVIYHGLQEGITLTKKLRFKDVVSNAILPYAFYATPYPLVLSIENHCSLGQQEKMVDHLKSILGPLLFDEPVDEVLKNLPSPEMLLNKILIKNKKIRAGASEQDLKSSISKDLSDLVNYMEAVKFKDIDQALIENKYYQMSSLSETTASDILTEHPLKLLQYNRTNITRIYPSGIRQDSSNLDPFPFWGAGCQMVTLNYQTKDKANMYNRTLFADNGGCGYVLKPEFLRDPTLTYSPRSPSNLSNSHFPQWIVSVSVLLGKHLPKPKLRLDRLSTHIRPFVKVRILGHPDDEDNTGETDVIERNWRNPIWGGRHNTFQFHVKVPLIAMMEFRVKDQSLKGNERHMGAACVLLTTMKEGYRRIYLEDYDGKSLYPASLFVHVKICK